MTDIEIAKLIIAQYAGDTSGFDVSQDESPVNGFICWGAKKLPDGSTLLVPEGSHSRRDWFRDFTAFAQHVPTLGWVERGFYTGLLEWLAEVRRLTTGPYVIGAHSLGAAHGCLIAPLLNVREMVLFGCPRPGFVGIKEMLAGVTIRSYRNRHGLLVDPVTDVPEFLPPLFAYEHVSDFIDVSAPPPDVLDLFGLHHEQRYLEGLEKLEAQKAASA